MKTLSVIVMASIFSFSAFAGVVTVECTAPRQLTGGASIKLAELKEGKKTPEGYSIYTGTLDVVIGGSTRKPVFKGPVRVKGVLLADGALHLAGIDSKVSSIYINENRDSYVEMADGRPYLTECRFY